MNSALQPQHRSLAATRPHPTLHSCYRARGAQSKQLQLGGLLRLCRRPWQARLARQPPPTRPDRVAERGHERNWPAERSEVRGRARAATTRVQRPGRSDDRPRAQVTGHRSEITGCRLPATCSYQPPVTPSRPPRTSHLSRWSATWVPVANH